MRAAKRPRDAVLRSAATLLLGSLGAALFWQHMSVQLGVDPAFVAAHHVLRVVILTFLVPALLRDVRRKVGHKV